MKITVFTGNQSRHVNLINRLSSIAERVYAVQECNTVFPGLVKDFFNNTPTFQRYFKKVLESERKVFGPIGFVNDNVHTLSIKSGDLNSLDMGVLSPALQSDYYVVFGSSFIKGELIEFLVERKAINIHMGVSPYYRGNSCNFWAAYDGNFPFVGATIHMLSKGLDSGDMLFHALPKADRYAAFDLGMYAVKAAQDSLVSRIKTGEIRNFTPVRQDKSQEMRYTRNSDFNDAVAEEYMESEPSPERIFSALENRDLSKFLSPYISE